MKRIFLFICLIVFVIVGVAFAGTGLGTNPIGVNNADNAYNSDTIAANEDGSVLERLEQIQEGVNKGTGTALPANKSLYDVTGAYTADGGADDEDTIMAHLDLVYADSAALDDFKEKSVSKEISTITNGNHDLFVVAGGPIKILEIVAYVTTEIGAEGNLVNYNIDPTTPATDTVFGTDGTALETNADAVGTLYTWDGVVANDLTATTNGVALGVAAESGIIVPAGSIELACANDGSVDGAITVYMRYIPLASGVTVTAAS